MRESVGVECGWGYLALAFMRATSDGPAERALPSHGRRHPDTERAPPREKVGGRTATRATSFGLPRVLACGVLSTGDSRGDTNVPDGVD